MPTRNAAATGSKAGSAGRATKPAARAASRAQARRDPGHDSLPRTGAGDGPLPRTGARASPPPTGPAHDSLARYHAKRDFAHTPEPRGSVRAEPGALSFTIQRHAARRLHYDLRLEWAGTLKSWAVPRGPSLDPKERRLAVRTEDHPLEYLTFQGVIPADQYGAGEMVVWDTGLWTPIGDVEAGLAKGSLKFRLEGAKLRGGWALVRMHGRDEGGKEQWLLIKERDGEARTGADADIVALRPEPLDPSPAGAAGEIDLTSSGGAGAPAGERVRPAVAPRARASARTGSARRTASVSLQRDTPALPDSFSPQLATLVDAPPAGAGWVYEVKYDGYRMLARVAPDGVRLLSRNGRDWTARMPRLAAALARLPVRGAWLDGEVVVPEADGTTSFQALQNAFETNGSDRGIVYFVFDLLHLDGEAWTHRPLLERKERLQELLATLPEASPVRYAEHLAGSGEAALDGACRMGLEGLIAKRADATYVAGRTRTWLKLKCRRRQEFVIAGWTEPGGTREALGSLVLGYYDEHGRLRYAGRVGTGFDAPTLARLSQRLAPLANARSPFAEAPRIPGVHWVRPRLVAEVAFASWTDEGLVRQASFVGLREDKNPTAIGREREEHVARAAPQGDVFAGRSAPGTRPGDARPSAATVADARASPPAAQALGAASARPRARTGSETVAGIRITHPERELFPGTGIRKLELAAYHEALGEHILRHVRGRPLMLLRCPSGSRAACFHQKHPHRGMPEAIGTVAVAGDPLPHLVANSVAALVGLVQFGAIELHTWGATAPHLDRPDRIVLDLDPDESLDWPRVREAALLVRTLLEELRLPAFLKTTGGKGLHVVVPLSPRHGWDEVKAFARALAEHLVAVFPDRFTAKLAKASRGGRVFIDWLRNAEGATAVAALSVRARDGAPVSMPVEWAALDEDIRGARFHLRNVPELLASGTDPWADYEASRARITAGMKRALGR